MTYRHIIRTLGMAVLLATSLAGAGPCDGPDHRAFDFWVGEWDVYGKNGKLAGTNTITREYNSCVIHEHYSTPRGYSGESFNMYDAGRKIWHQTWVDSTGTLLLLDGGVQDGKMVLEGSAVAKNGKPIKHRITFTPNPDGTVRQFWQSAGEDGDWKTAFDGLYRPSEATATP